MKKILRIVSFLVLFVSPFYSIAQLTNPLIIAQIRSYIANKGLTEEETRLRLKTKGIDVDTLSQGGLTKNRLIIEQSIAELVGEKKTLLMSNTPRPNLSSDTLGSKNILLADSVKTRIDDSLNISKSNIYGHQLFKNNALGIYRVSTDASPPESYILAAGDRINVLIFGRSQADFQYEINSAGFIQPAQMPKIFLSGLTLKQARELLSKRFSLYYVFGSDQFAVSLSTSRTLNVNIFGEVFNPGTYTTSALNTILNALSLSGGVIEFGTVRNIQIIRGTSKSTLDVYNFIRNPSLQFDYFLQNNDIIYVPPAEIVVTVEGPINRPMRYELKASETIADLIKYAGGLQADAYSEFVQIERFEKNQKMLKDYLLDEVLTGKAFVQIQNGDIIRFKTINSPLRNIVKISGAVKYPGSYDFDRASFISSLLDVSKLLPEAKLDQAVIIKTNADRTKKVITFVLDDILKGKTKDIALDVEDEVIIYDHSKFVDQFNISVRGEVRAPVEVNYNSNLNLKELITIAGGTTIAANTLNIEVFRINFENNKSPRNELLKLEVDSDLNALHNKKPFVFQPYDILVIRKIPDFKYQEVVTLTGEVVNPGPYLIETTNFTFSDLIKKAGGLTSKADINHVSLTRFQGLYEDILFDSGNALSRPHNPQYDPILLNEDILNVPVLENIVQIANSGLNSYDSTELKKVLFVGPASAVWYVNSFMGGFSRDADKSSLIAMSNNGLIKRTKNFLFFRKYPTVRSGDIIRVAIKPSKIRAANLEPKPFDWDKTLTKLISVVTAYALISRTFN